MFAQATAKRLLITNWPSKPLLAVLVGAAMLAWAGTAPAASLQQREAEIRNGYSGFWDKVLINDNFKTPVEAQAAANRLLRQLTNPISNESNLYGHNHGIARYDHRIRIGPVTTTVPMWVAYARAKGNAPFGGGNNSNQGGGAGNSQAANSGSPSPSLPATYGSVNLSSGFLPDPFIKSLVAGGGTVTTLGGVRAHVATAPDFKLHYTSGNLPLTFRVESSSDTTLLINLPDGTWIANDDAGGGLNPLLRLERPQSGRYDIWVGTYGSQPASARLIITER